MNKNKFKISKNLASHDSILKAVTTYGLKEILTLEKGNHFYWVRLYKNKYITKQFYYYDTFEKALNDFNYILNELKNDGLNLKFNQV